MDSKKESFFALTPDRVLEAVESFGVHTTGRVLQLNSMENRVYEIELDLDDAPENPSDRFRVVKFYRPGRWSRAQIGEEHQFLADLHAQELPVVPPVVLENGATLGELAGKGIFFSLFPKRGGRTLDEMTPDLAVRIGRLIARMHNVGAQRKATTRLRLTPEVYGLENLRFLLETDALPPSCRAQYVQTVKEICARGEDLYDGISLQRVHGDLHFGNVLYGRDSLTLVDFDDMVVGPCVQDLWLLLPGDDPWGREIRNALLAGYEEFRSFEWQSLRLVELLRALRYVHFSAWIARRWDDPSFPKVFPTFGTDAYWRGQLADLTEQLEKLSSSPNRGEDLL